MSDLPLVIAALREIVIARDAAIVPLAQERDRALLAIKALTEPIDVDDPALDRIHVEVTSVVALVPHEPYTDQEIAMALAAEPVPVLTLAPESPPDAEVHPTHAEVAAVCRDAHTNGMPYAEALRRAFGWNNTRSQSQIQRARAYGEDIPRLRNPTEPYVPADPDLRPTLGPEFEPKPVPSEVQAVADKPAPKPAKPKPGALVLRCQECDDFEIEVFTPNATGHLSRHTTTKHHRRPTIDEKKPVEQVAA